MHTTTTAVLAAVAEDTPRGWGGPVAILIAVAVFIAFATVWDRVRGGQEDPSPTPGDTPGVTVSPQVSEVSGTGDTSRDTASDTNAWWAHPSITGRRMSKVVQVLRTGSSAPADGDQEEDIGEPDGDEPVDDDVDLALETPEARMLQDIVRMLADGTHYSDIVRYVMGAYDVSERTAKRRIADVRAAQAGAA